MKKLFIILLSIYTCTVFADTEIQTDIKSVTVSLSGAQIFRSGVMSYPKGVSKTIIDNVSPDIRDQGIQATSSGNYRIMDVKHILKYPEPLKTKPTVMPERIAKEINLLQDSIFYATLQKENMEMKIQTIKKQKDIINNNKLTTGAGRSDTLPVLKSLVEYYQNKLFELEDELMNFNMKYRRLNQGITKMNNRLRELNNFNRNTNQPFIPVKVIHQIEVTIYATQASSSNIEVNYLVNNAGWYPAYDLRVDDINKPLTFTYKAYVFQNTKEDWKNVDISLITYDSRINNEKPKLSAWIVDYYKEQIVTHAWNKKQLLSNIQLSTLEENASYKEVIDYDDETEGAIRFDSVFKTDINQTLSNFTFDIDLPYSIKSDGKESLIIINDQELEAEYKHYITPKLDTKAYLLASVPNWESMNLLTGSTNLYFAKSYLGNTVLNPTTLEDTLAIDLGVDRSIVCTRKKTKDADKCRTIGNKRTQQITIEIVIKNNKNTEVSIEIEDQVPITRNEKIEIEINDKGNGDLNSKNGKLVWDIKLKPQEKRIIEFTYTLKYDKHERIM